MTIFTLVAMMFIATFIPGSARADTLNEPMDGTFLPYEINHIPVALGALARDGQGNNYYCIETGATVEFEFGERHIVNDGDRARTLAWLMDHYRDTRDPDAHAAIGWLTHEWFDLLPEKWSVRKDLVLQEFPHIPAKADALLAQAAAKVPDDATVEQHYVQGLRRGAVEVVVRNAQGAVISGIPYELTITGPAVFGNDAQQLRGVSGASAISHQWHATGRGEVKVAVAYEYQQVEQVASGQDFLRYGGASFVNAGGVNFTVRKDFVPTLSTKVDRAVVDPGEPVVDQVTSGVQGGGDQWVPELRLDAVGWYFHDVTHNQLHGPVAASQGESAQAFVKRLHDLGHVPAAYGSAQFTGPGQTRTVTAVTEPGGSTPYEAPIQGGFGTWVWAFERSGLSDEASEYVLSDVVSPFLEVSETNVNRASLSVWSSVTEHSATVGSELTDTITVSGFPDDHGSFEGDERYGYEPDLDLAQVRVWWSGDADEPTDYERYKPAQEEEPVQDEHHRIIGTWDYPAVNGTIRVGGGSPDARGTPVQIDAKQPGWYVFVWSFLGDDRVVPYTSAYDDAWERTKVERFANPLVPSIVTKVDRDAVEPGDPFHDSAHVVGQIDPGSYVAFSAFRVDPKGAGKSDVSGERSETEGLKIIETLQSSQKVALDPTVRTQTVTSPTARTEQPGLVYWQATVVSPQGDVLASHDLGIPGEVVRVLETSPHVETLAQTGMSVMPIATGSILLLAAGLAMFVMARTRGGSSGRSQQTDKRRKARRQVIV